MPTTPEKKREQSNNRSKKKVARFREQGWLKVELFILEQNKTLLQSLQGDMRQKKIKRIVFEGE